MGATAIQSDFVMLLQSQLTALQAENREALDLTLLACEFESVVGRYRNEIQERAKNHHRDIDAYLLGLTATGQN